jgi:bifunctional UDP-N-acetylglucosamine pyrophosphorylase/glucosamine-1-phosphate N-acetyltransferase
MRQGVTMTDPERTYIDTTVELESDVTLRPGTILEGRTVIGARSEIGPDSHLVDTIVGDDVVIRQSVAVEAEVGDESAVGPFAHLRPGTRLGARVRIGNFVETKNADVHDGAKANHLSYLGDAEVGEGANIGAGTITANYDGRDKHRTAIGRRVRTGSNTVLVAPVTVGDDSLTGAGAVVTRDVPPSSVAKGVPARSEPVANPREPDDVREDEQGDAGSA